MFVRLSYKVLWIPPRRLIADNPIEQQIFMWYNNNLRDGTSEKVNRTNFQKQKCWNLTDVKQVQTVIPGFNLFSKLFTVSTVYTPFTTG